MNKYFRAKYDWYVQQKLKQLEVTTRDLEEKLTFNKEKDEMVKRRFEFMYNFMDYDNDRTRMRQRFIAEMNKKTSLKDIGEALDKFIVDEKGESLRFWDPAEEDHIKYASKD